MRNKKVYISIACGLVLLAIGYLALRSDVPEEPIVIYKATTPLPKQPAIRDITPSTPNPDVQADRTPATETSEDSEINISPVDLSHPADESPPAETAETETVSDESEIPVSPHGFGPYPDVPSDYFRTPVWAYPDSEFTPGHELIDRVLIKLWKQGIYSYGGSIENGRVYPVTRGTVYVKWKGDYISDYIGHPDDDDEQIISILEDKGMPTGITVLDYDTAGIDPYQFLNLK